MLPLQVRMDPGAMAIKRYAAFPKAPALLEPHYEIVYPGHLFWGWGYPSPEKQSVYSKVPTEWATGHSLVESYSLAEKPLVYSKAPVHRANL